MTSRWRKAGYVLLVVLAPVLIYRLIPYRYRHEFFQLDSPFNEMAFDKSVWDADRRWGENPNARINMRAFMIDDLMSHQLRKGMTKAQVISILGESNHLDYRGANQFMYYLGYTCGPLCLDPDFFAVEFDGQDKVIDFRIVGT